VHRNSPIQSIYQKIGWRISMRVVVFGDKVKEGLTLVGVFQEKTTPTC
jgi:hypothetical protein